MPKNQPYLNDLIQRDKKCKSVQPQPYTPIKHIDPAMRRKLFAMQAEEDRLQVEQKLKP